MIYMCMFGDWGLGVVWAGGVVGIVSLILRRGLRGGSKHGIWVMKGR